MGRTKEEQFIGDNWDEMTKEQQEEVAEHLRKAFKKAYYFIMQKKEKEKNGR